MELKELYYQHLKDIRDGQIVKGKVVGVSGNEVIVDIGYKSEGFIPREEFLWDDVEIGQEIDVYVDTTEDEDGMLIISKRKADRTIGWEKIISNYKEGSIAKGKVAKIVKGGFLVDICGMDCFLPNSLSTFRGREKEVLGQEFNFMIIKINRLRKNIVVSRRDAIQKEKEEARKKLWTEINEGDIREGIVKNITDFGVFIDLGGVDGLLHITDMSWGKVGHPSDLVSVGEKIKVKVLSVDKESGKVALGLKQLTEDPWKNIEDKYPIGSKVKGKVVNTMPYGVFVEIEVGVEGLVHVSELSWTKRNINPAEMFNLGDEIEAVVLNIDPQKRKISLGVKQLLPNPWDEIDKKIAVGDVVKGVVRGFTDYGAFVEIMDGIEGMVHVSDMSWTRKVTHPQEIVKRGQKLEVKVLAIDKGSQRISLGLKQLTPNPWPELVEKYKVDTVVEGEVVKITNFGVFVKLEDNLEGLVYMSEIEKGVVDQLKPHDKVKVRVIKVDPNQMKIGLSMKDINNEDVEKGEGNGK